MKYPTLRPLLPFLFFSLAFLSCAAKSTPPKMVSLGDNLFSITRQASNAFDRDVARLRAEVQEDAAQYCTAQGRQLVVENVTDEKPWFSLGFVSATIVFRALTPDELTASKAPAATAAASPDKVTATGDLYNDLLKLDDLRKKGILTKEEFKIEKQKILNRQK